MKSLEERIKEAHSYRIEWNTCRICGERNRNKTYTAKEMMYRTGEEFDYFVCSTCKCMQIAEIPGNLGKYYADNYYSLKERETYDFEGNANVENKILDVGCGTGKWLLRWAEEGYGNLFGCDPFIEEDVSYGNRIFIKKCEIDEMEGKFDFIRFSDSFEHITRPLETLQSVKRLLNFDGMCEIQIPVFPNAAWDTFGINWYQIDAPRHIFLHSVESMRYLCEKCNLKIDEIRYNSNEFQFAVSYFYMDGYSYEKAKEQISIVCSENREWLEAFQKNAVKCNERKYGDHAVFNILHG